jgi:hypothetical protein
MHKCCKRDPCLPVLNPQAARYFSEEMKHLLSMPLSFSVLAAEKRSMYTKLECSKDHVAALDQR